jgi:hypothetical protein
VRFRHDSQALFSLFIFVCSVDSDERIKSKALRLVHSPMIAVVCTGQNDWGRLEVQIQPPIGYRSATERLLKKCWSERAGHAITTTHSLNLGENTQAQCCKKSNCRATKESRSTPGREEVPSDDSASWPPPLLGSRLGSCPSVLIVNRPSLARTSSRGRLIVDVQARRYKSPSQ